MSVASPPQTDGAPATARPAVVVAVVLVAAFLVVADASIVNVAIPVLQRDLAASSSQAQLVLVVYQLTFGVLLITGSRLGDRFDCRRVFLVGLGGFVVTSLVCGLAPTAAVLIAARVAQGVAAALMFPQTLAVIQIVLPPQRRAGALTAFGITASLATMAGPLISGALIHLDIAHTSWRPSFLINIPIGLAGWVLARRRLPEFRATGPGTLDPTGVALLTAGLALVILPLVEGPDLGWPWWLVVVLAASAPCLIAFGGRARAREAAGRDPLIAPALWRDRAFTVGFLAYLGCYAGLVSFVLYTSLTLQDGLGLGALGAALMLTPFAGGSTAGYLTSLRLQRRWGGRRTVVTGGVVWCTGIAGALVTCVAGVVTPGVLVPSFVVAGVGLGFVLAPILGVVLAGVQPSLAATASGVLSTGQQVGAVLGVALAGTAFWTSLDPAGPRPQAYTAAYLDALGVVLAVLVTATTLMSRLPAPAPAPAPAPERSREGSVMAVELDHLIVPAHDREAAASFVADVLGLAMGDEVGPFRPVRVANALTLDFMQTDDDVESQHYAFRVTEEEFDGIRDRLTERGATYFADPRHHEAGAVNHDRGGRGLYFNDLSGHRLEILTQP